MAWLRYAAFAAAVLLLPTPTLSRAQLRRIGLIPATPRSAATLAVGRRLAARPWAAAALVGVAGAACGAVAGWVVGRHPAAALLPAAAIAIAGLACWHAATAAAASRRLDREAGALSEALHCLGDELRAGERPPAALAAAAEAADHLPIAQVFLRAAAAASLGGAVPAAIRAEVRRFKRGGPAAAGVEAFAAAWAVSERTGAALAVVLERLTGDVRSRQHQRRQVLAQLAGPRATAALLAVLPVLGILLAAGVGARPLEILFGTLAGQLALLAGVLLDALGVLWTLRILDAACGDP